jgi:tetratricopeptide (TPR) repeat protein
MEEQLQPSGAAQHLPGMAKALEGPALDADNIRQAISVLMAQGEIAMATEMAELANILHPGHEAILAVGALVAEVNQDWLKAHALLAQLQQLQGPAVTAETLQHQIRVLRCMGSTAQALDKAKEALDRFPANEALQTEYEEMLACSTTSADLPD